MNLKEKKIKGGAMIIGSLFWETGSNCLKDAVELGKIRTKWRNENLVVSDAEQVKIPIRYGKISSTRKNTHTMVFSREYLDKRSYGLIVPFKEKFNFTAKGILEIEVIKMAEAEGIYKSDGEWLARDWCAMAIWINPKSVYKNEVRKEWKLILNKDNFCFRRKGGYQRNSRSSNDYSGSDGILLNEDFELIDVPIKCDFDFLILTYTKPDLVYSNTEVIAKAIRKSHYSSYLLNNIKNRIVTLDDKEISKFLKQNEAKATRK